jgi:putative tryptophan/tyrosine transport system substrate-binding protein
LALELHVLYASAERDFAAAFEKLTQLRIGGLVLGAGSLFSGNGERIAHLALRHAVPALFEGREFVAADGLMSYGGSLTDSYRQAGVTPPVFSKAKSLANCRSSRVQKLSCS